MVYMLPLCIAKVGATIFSLHCVHALRSNGRTSCKGFRIAQNTERRRTHSSREREREKEREGKREREREERERERERRRRRDRER